MSDAVKSYCIKCNIPIPWTVKDLHLQRHMTKYHGDNLAKKRKGTAAAADDKQQTLNQYLDSN